MEYGCYFERLNVEWHLGSHYDIPNTSLSAMGSRPKFKSKLYLFMVLFESLSIENEIFVAEVDIETYKELATSTCLIPNVSTRLPIT